MSMRFSNSSKNIIKSEPFIIKKIVFVKICVLTLFNKVETCDLILIFFFVPWLWEIFTELKKWRRLVVSRRFNRFFFLLSFNLNFLKMIKNSWWMSWCRWFSLYFNSCNDQNLNSSLRIFTLGFNGIFFLSLWDFHRWDFVTKFAEMLVEKSTFSCR